MKKTIMGALCAIALTIGMTSCNDTEYITFSDIKEVCTTYDDQGHATAHYAIIKKDGKEDVLEISRNALNVLTSDKRTASDIVCFTYRHGSYYATISHAHTESITLND